MLEYTLEGQLKQAQAALDAREAAVTSEVLLERLRHHSPLNPLLLAYWFFMMSMSMSITLSLAVLAVPLAGRNVMREVALLEERISFSLPVLLLVLAFCAGGLAVGARALALLRGASAPRLPDEQAEYQELYNEVVRLKALIANQPPDLDDVSARARHG